MTVNRSVSYQLHPLTDAVEPYISIASESLLSHDPKNWQSYISRIGLENMRALFAKAASVDRHFDGGEFVGGEFVGGLGIYRMGQCFGGRAIATAGISGVAIHPGHRGAGACGQMMEAVIRELYAEGTPLSSLYASTQRPYRQCGYAQAGTQTQYAVRLAELFSSGIKLDRSLPAYRFTSPPLSSLKFADQQRAKDANGLLQRSDGLWNRLLDPYDGRGSITYLLGDEAKPEGFVILRPGTRERGVPQPLISTDVVTNTPQSLQRLVALLHDHRSMHDEFHWFGSPTDPLVLFSARSTIDVLQQLRWMLRIINLPLAIGHRGFPVSVGGDLHLDIHDPTIDENSGRWVVSLKDGVAEVDRGGQGLLRLEIGWLATLFSSYLTPAQLMNIGKLQVDERNADTDNQLQLATAAFAGAPPWMPELF